MVSIKVLMCRTSREEGGQNSCGEEKGGDSTHGDGTKVRETKLQEKNSLLIRLIHVLFLAF